MRHHPPFDDAKDDDRVDVRRRHRLDCHSDTRAIDVLPCTDAPHNKINTHRCKQRMNVVRAWLHPLSGPNSRCQNKGL